MNNDKYAKYAKEVVYASNGAYASHKETHAQKDGNGCLPMMIVMFLLVAGLLFGGKALVGHAMGITHTQLETKAGLFGDCMADTASGDVYATPDDYCQVYPSGKAVERHNHATVSESVVTPATDNDTPSIDTPAIVTPPTDNPAVNEEKHPNSGGGNGSELDASGNDVDPGNSGKNKGGD